MNKTDRLLAIILELQSKGRQRAEDLAATFETSKRTIYRDIQALCEAGVPLISIPGQGYSLMKGYFLPPLSFTTEEATMLLLGSDFMAQNFDAQYRAAAQSASRKIAGVLPEKLRDEVQYLQGNIHFVAPSGNPAERSKLQLLRRALIECRTVRFHYHTRHGSDGQSAQATREADPYSLVYMFNTWHMTAYCHLRRARRHFRLDRMDDLELLSETFQRSTDPWVHERQEDRDKSRTLIVRALFDHQITRWVREGRSFYAIAEEECADGLLVTLKIRHESEVLQWLLSWGRHVRILEPESLRQLLADEAQSMLHNYQPELVHNAMTRGE